jgi:hypothetical protein
MSIIAIHDQLPNRALQGERRECQQCRGTGLVLVGGVQGCEGIEYRALCPHCGGTGWKRLWIK